MLLKLGGKLSHSHAANFAFANQRAQFFKELRDNIFEPWPLRVKVFGMKPDVKNATFVPNAV